MSVYKKGKSSSRVSKSAKKGKFKLKKWMIFTGIGVIALVGFIVLRYSFASIDIPECSTEPLLSENAKAEPSDCVINLQVKLNNVMGARLIEDGIFNERTSRAVRQFQEKYAVAIERNQVGPNTWAKLNEEFEKKTRGQVVGAYKVALLEAKDGSMVQANACLSMNKKDIEQVRIWYKKITKDGRKRLSNFEGYYIASSDLASSQVQKGNSWIKSTNESSGSPATFRLQYRDPGLTKYSAGTNNYKFYVGIGYDVALYNSKTTTKSLIDNILKNGGQAIEVKALNLCPDSKTLPIQRPASKPKIIVKTTKSNESKPVVVTLPPPPPPPNPTPPPDLSFLNYPGYELYQGSTGGPVKVLQVLLCISPSDGIFGPQTNAEVRRYQSLNELLVDGIVGPQTWAKMVSSESGYKPLCAGEPPLAVGVGGPSPNPIVTDPIEPSPDPLPELALCRVFYIYTGGVPGYGINSRDYLYDGNYTSRNGCMAVANYYQNLKPSKIMHATWGAADIK